MSAHPGFLMQPIPGTLPAGRTRWPGVRRARRRRWRGTFMLQTLLQTFRHLCDRRFQREAIERARASLRASPLVRKVCGDREAVRDALGWLGWALAGALLLLAAWRIGGFGVLVGQGPSVVPAPRQQVVRVVPAEVRAEGCTQASLNRTTGRTTAAKCQQALRSQ